MSSFRQRSGTRRWFAVLCALVLLAAACSDDDGAAPTGEADASASSEEGTRVTSDGEPTGKLVYSPPQLVTNFDPDLQLSGASGMYYVHQLYDTLTLIEGDLSLHPLLAKAWRVDEDDRGRFVEFELEEGLSFPDGAPFNSATVAENVERSQTLQGSRTASDLVGVTVEEVSEYVVRLRSENAASLPALMGTNAGMMISQQAIADGVNLAEKAVGNGMFLLDSRRGNTVTYTANPNYWRPGIPKIETLVLDGSADDNARVNLMRTKSIDMAFVDPALREGVERLGGWEQHISDNMSTYSVALDPTMAPFDDVRVREAAHMAVDKEGILNSILYGEGFVTSQFPPKVSPAYNPEIDGDTVPYDPERARGLLEEAGATGAKIDLLAPANPTKFARIAEAVAAAWTEIGLDVTILPSTLEQYASEWAEGAGNATILGATAWIDPYQGVTTYFAPGSVFNRGNLPNDELMELAARAQGEFDADKRNAIFQELSAAAIQIHQYIPIASTQVRMFTLEGKVKGYGSTGAYSQAATIWEHVSVVDG